MTKGSKKFIRQYYRASVDSYAALFENYFDFEQWCVGFYLAGNSRGTLTEDQVEQLQEGEWGKKPLQMQIKIQRVGRRIKKATLIRVGLSVEQ